jgi:hypothetical protein
MGQYLAVARIQQRKQISVFTEGSQNVNVSRASKDDADNLQDVLVPELGHQAGLLQELQTLFGRDVRIEPLESDEDFAVIVFVMNVE